MTPADALRHYFGHSSFRGGQEAAINAILNGHSTHALFPTGAGKSLTYPLPALLLPGTTVVVSPLIALMKDQVGTLRSKGIAAAQLDSTLSPDARRQTEDDFSSGRLKLLYVAPERFASDAFRRRLTSTQLSLLAIDEAHCISEWGHNFRPDYLRLAAIAAALRPLPVLCLTATATPATAADICSAFAIAPAHRIQTSVHRPNLSYQSSPLAAADRLPHLIKALQNPDRLPAIVYVTRQETAEHLATSLQRHHIPARAYHAGLPDDYRAEAQDAFMSGQCPVMVATIAFGMGVDKANIRAVYHYNLPKSLENLLQESGRAGRDGLPAHCEILACGDDLNTLRNFICGDTPGPRAVSAVIDSLLRQGPDLDVSLYDLSLATDTRPHVTETLLAALETDGLIAAVGSFHSRCRIRFLRPQEKVIASREPAERASLQAILATATSGRLWLSLDLTITASTTGLSMPALREALSWLEQDGDAILQFSHRRLSYRRLTDNLQPTRIAATMAARFAAREQQDLARLDDVVACLLHHGCLTARLLAHFGDSLPAPCGHCANCLHPPSAPLALPASPIPAISADDVTAIHSLIAERRPALRSARQITRFLCGLSGPAIQRAKLSSHDSFGRLAEIPFLDVLDHVSTLVPP